MKNITSSSSMAVVGDEDDGKLQNHGEGELQLDFDGGEEDVS